MNSPDQENLSLELDRPSGVIRLKAAATFGDPVELTADEARDLAGQLNLLAEELD